MKITMKNIEIVNKAKVIDKALNDNIDAVLSAKVCYKIIKGKLAMEQAARAYNIAYDKIIMAKSNGSGEINKDKDPELFDEVTRELNSIAIEETEVDVPTITIDELGDAKLPIGFVQAIDFMIQSGES